MTQPEINRLRSVNVLDVAEDLGLKVRGRSCLCPLHADNNPSLKFRPSKNDWKCFGCGEKGTNIDLVMKVNKTDFVSACHWIAERHGISLSGRSSSRLKEWRDVPTKPIAAPRPVTDVIDSQYVKRCLSTSTAFCRAVVSSGILDEGQMKHAAGRYRLGSTKDGGVIFWQIDERQQVREGKIMFYCPDAHRDHHRTPSWVSYRLRKSGILPSEWKSTHCLFGLHLLGEEHREPPIVAVVESEKTAIICSERFPTLGSASIVWMATGGLSNLTVDSLRPLVGHRVILFPDTDPDGQAFGLWSETATKASAVLHHPFYVSRLLEDNSSSEQKSMKIDLADVLGLRVNG